jgi:hypothetical protein
MLISFSPTEAKSQGVDSHVTLASAPVPSGEKAGITEQVFTELPDTSLCEALEQLERISRIQFKCPEKLGDHLIYARTLEGPDWASVTQEFLEDYNTLVIYNNAGEMTQVYLLGSKGQALSTQHKTTSKPIHRQKVQPEATSGTPGSNLNRSQLFALLKTSTFKPFPQHFFNISDFQGILNFAEIKTPEDWLVAEKSSALKQHIKQLLIK